MARKPTGIKPVLAEILAGFDQVTGDQQDRFVADLAKQLLASGRRVSCRPAGGRGDRVTDWAVIHSCNTIEGWRTLAGQLGRSSTSPIPSTAG